MAVTRRPSRARVWRRWRPGGDGGLVVSFPPTHARGGHRSRAIMGKRRCRHACHDRGPARDSAGQGAVRVVCGDVDRTCATHHAPDRHHPSVASAVVHVVLGLIDERRRNPAARRGAAVGGGPGARTASNRTGSNAGTAAVTIRSRDGDGTATAPGQLRPRARVRPPGGLVHGVTRARRAAHGGSGAQRMNRPLIVARRGCHMSTRRNRRDAPSFNRVHQLVVVRSCSSSCAHPAP